LIRLQISIISERKVPFYAALMRNNGEPKLKSMLLLRDRQTYYLGFSVKNSKQSCLFRSLKMTKFIDILNTSNRSSNTMAIYGRVMPLKTLFLPN